MVVNHPYQETANDSSIIRTFSESVEIDDLVWHRDRNSRTVRVIESNGWKFQYDNEIPMLLNNDDVLYIPKEMYHRVIRGHGPLIIEIINHQD